MGQLAPSVGKEPPLYLLAGIGAILTGLTLVTPFAFQAGGDNAFIALAIPASLLTLMATRVAERTPTNRALLLIFGIGIMLRIYVLLFDPLLSTDVFRYIWDGRVQAAGINPYRYFPTTMRWRICAMQRSFPGSIGPTTPSQSIRQSPNSSF